MAKKKEKRGRQMPIMRPHAAGMDIGTEKIYVAVPCDHDEQPVRCFSTFTCDLHALAEWLQRCGIDTVAMESTGVYWIPIFQILESSGFEVFMVNAHYLKSVPGRKSDVSDCQWIQYLHSVVFCKTASALRTKYALSVRCGGIVRVCSRWLPNTFCTCRNRSVK